MVHRKISQGSVIDQQRIDSLQLPALKSNAPRPTWTLIDEITDALRAVQADSPFIDLGNNVDKVKALSYQSRQDSFLSNRCASPTTLPILLLPALQMAEISPAAPHTDLSSALNEAIESDDEESKIFPSQHKGMDYAVKLASAAGFLNSRIEDYVPIALVKKVVLSQRNASLKIVAEFSVDEIESISSVVLDEK